MYFMQSIPGSVINVGRKNSQNCTSAACKCIITQKNNLRYESIAWVTQKQRNIPVELLGLFEHLQRTQGFVNYFQILFLSNSQQKVSKFP